MTGFIPPVHPYDRLDEARSAAAALPGGAVDCSIGTPHDAPPDSVVEALANSGAERGYPQSMGSPAFREAAADWLLRRLDVRLDPDTDLAACIGTKEFVANVPHHLRLRTPERDTVLYPAVSYPSYAMGARLANCRAVPIPVDDQWRMDLSAIDPADAARALCLWVNTPGNPAGGLDDLVAVAAWGRAHDVAVFSDECYVEFTWQGEARTILTEGLDGVVAVHSLSKRSNLAGARAGFYAGDPVLVKYLREVRQHAGCMVPGPVQAAAVAAWEDQAHVDVQRELYRERLELGIQIFAALGVEASMPDGGFYLWVAAPDDDAWALTNRLARQGGLIVSPGEFYGDESGGYVRLAVVQPTERLKIALDRLT